MKHLLRTTLVFLSIILVQKDSSAQIFGGIMNEAKRKIEKKVEDKIVQAVSDELARRAFKPIDQAMDSLMRQKYQDSVGKGQKVDWDKMGDAYAAFLADMNKTIELPEKYSFDITQEVEVIDYSKKRNYIRLHYSKKDAIIGMESLDEKQTKQLVVIDLQKDAMILYTTEKNGDKTGQVIPSVMKLGAAASSSVKAEKSDKWKIRKTGKSKKVAGYNSQEYSGETSDEKILMYVSENFPINIQKNFQPYMSKFAPSSYTENMAGTEQGIMLEYENIRKDEKGEKTTWVTKKISEKPFDLVNADFKFASPKE